MINKEIISSLCGLMGKYNLTDKERQTIEKTIEVLSNLDVLDKIRAEIIENLSNAENGCKRTQDDIDYGICIGLQMALDVIDKHNVESEDKEK